MYRVDKRKFCIGEFIRPTGKYMCDLTPTGSKIEKTLESSRPSSNPSRSNALFLFENYCEALKYWSKQKNGTFYEVKAECILSHKYDMNITEKMYSSSDAWEIFSSNYWNGLPSGEPCWEFLVSKATVIDIISKSEQEREAVFNYRNSRDPEEKGLPNVDSLVRDCFPKPLSSSEDMWYGKNK